MTTLTHDYVTTNKGKRYCKHPDCDQYGLPTWSMICEGCLKITSILAPRFKTMEDD